MLFKRQFALEEHAEDMDVTHPNTLVVSNSRKTTPSPVSSEAVRCAAAALIFDARCTWCFAKEG